MSRVYATRVDTEHMEVDATHEMVNILRGKDLKPKREELWSVGTERHGDDDSSYLLLVVSHWTKPYHRVDAAADDRTETLVCGCTGYNFHCIDRDVGAKIDDCKHTKRVKELRKTDMPDQQATLEL